MDSQYHIAKCETIEGIELEGIPASLLSSCVGVPLNLIFLKPFCHFSEKFC